MSVTVNPAGMALCPPSVQTGMAVRSPVGSVRQLRPCSAQVSLSSSVLARPSAFGVSSLVQHVSLSLFSRSPEVMSIRCAVSATNTLPHGATEVDASYMRMCVELAKEAAGKTSPNPIVGCVIVKDGRIVGRGFHPKAGEPHAEVFALREAGLLAQGATAYVSLEPCNHHGRTPPCSQALVKAKLKRVVVGVVDPNPLVAGKGIETLRSAGIEVVEGVEEVLCRNANEAFIHRMVTGRPFVTLWYSMSMDGALLGNIGLSSGQGSLSSQLLQANDAVMVTDSVVYDDPILLSSEPDATQPLRVILARSLDLPAESRVFDTSAAKTLVLADQQACLGFNESLRDRLQVRGVEVVMVSNLTLEHALSVCAQRGATSVLLDSRGPLVFAGPESSLAQRAMERAVAQKVVVQVAPLFLGEQRRTEPGFRMDNVRIKLLRMSSYMVGQDVVVEGYFPQPGTIL